MRISTIYLFELPKRARVEKCRLADLLAEIGFSCEENASFSNRVCTKGSTKISNTTGLIRFFRCSLLVHAPLSDLGCSPIATERFKRGISGSPSCENSGKSSGIRSPMRNVQSSSKARRSISYGQKTHQTNTPGY